MAAASLQSNNPQPQGSYVGMIKLVGVLTKHDQPCGPRGMETIEGYVRELDADAEVGLIVLDIHSPGGSAHGTKALYDTIRGCSTKTLAFINDGMAASAAYYIASACDEVVLSNNVSQVGSIGTMVMIPDFKKHMKEHMKLDIHVIYAPQSSQKNEPSNRAFEGDYASMQEVLRVVAEQFINDVKAARGARLDLSKGDPFKGAMFFAQQALEIGLVDAIENLGSAVARIMPAKPVQSSGASAQEEVIDSENHHTDTIINPEQPMRVANTLVALLSAIGVEATEEGHELTQDNLEALNAALVQNSQEVERLNNELNQVTQERDNLQGQVDAFNDGSADPAEPNLPSDPSFQEVEGPELTETDVYVANLRKQAGFKD